MLTRELNEQFDKDPELLEINRDLKRVSVFLNTKSLKLFDYENKNQKISKQGI